MNNKNTQPGIRRSNDYTEGPFGERIYAPLPIQSRRDASDSPAALVARPSFSGVMTNSDNGRGAVEQQSFVSPQDYMKIMRDGRQRLRTFTEKRWPVSAQQSPLTLAEAGFFYLGDLDRVQCPFCRLVMKNWSAGDVPIMEHLKNSRRCDFILGYDVGNIPVNDDPVRGTNPLLPNFDVCGNHNHVTGRTQPMPRSSPSSEDEPMSSDEEYNNLDRFDPLSYDDTNLNRNRYRQPMGPSVPEMASYDVRLKSFDSASWQPSCPVSPSNLADAGLFYIGTEDHVKCFYCNGGICGWEPGDDPWAEHKRLFPHCEYIRLNMPDAIVPSIRISTSSESEDEESRADEVVEAWLQTDMLKQFKEHYQYSQMVIKNVLRQRFISERRPFASIEELHASVSSAAEHLRFGTTTLHSQESGYGSQVSSQSSSQMSSSPTTSSDDDVNTRLLCKVCLDRDIGVVFVPCGHLATCTRCAPAMKTCPICRQQINTFVRAFLP